MVSRIFRCALKIFQRDFKGLQGGMGFVLEGCDSGSPKNVPDT